MTNEERMARELCRAIHSAARLKRNRVGYWVGHGSLMLALGIEGERELDRIVLECLNRDWVRVNGVPVLAVCLTQKGDAMVTSTSASATDGKGISLRQAAAS